MTPAICAALARSQEAARAAQMEYVYDVWHSERDDVSRGWHVCTTDDTWSEGPMPEDDAYRLAITYNDAAIDKKVLGL